MSHLRLQGPPDVIKRTLARIKAKVPSMNYTGDPKSGQVVIFVDEDQVGVVSGILMRNR